MTDMFQGCKVGCQNILLQRKTLVVMSHSGHLKTCVFSSEVYILTMYLSYNWKNTICKVYSLKFEQQSLYFSCSCQIHSIKTCLHINPNFKKYTPNSPTNNSALGQIMVGHCTSEKPHNQWVSISLMYMCINGPQGINVLAIGIQHWIFLLLKILINTKFPL